MIRDMQKNGAQPKNTMYKAGADMQTGMGVVIKDTSTVGFATAETASGVYVVTKERVPSGTNAAKQDMSDYDEDFVNIETGEFVGLERYTDGEKFATDQFVAGDFADGTAGGFVCSVGTDGKWKKATKSTVASKYVFEGFHSDNGHKLIVIRVEDTATANA